MYVLHLKDNSQLYVEPYNDPQNEEDGRSKIFDSHKNYIDYIDTDTTTEDEYNQIINFYATQDTLDFCNNFATVFELYTDPTPLLEEFYTTEEIENDRNTLTDMEFCNKYLLNKLGNYYVIIGEY